MKQPTLIAAEVLAQSFVPTPRGDWYVILFAGKAGWSILRDGRSVCQFLTESDARRRAELRSLREYEIVRIPGNRT